MDIFISHSLQQIDLTRQESLAAMQCCIMTKASSFAEALEDKSKQASKQGFIYNKALLQSAGRFLYRSDLPISVHVLPEGISVFIPLSLFCVHTKKIQKKEGGINYAVS